nr:hypothetical protein [Tanacetum cinerariifolium]
AFTASSMIPVIYIQQFWDTMRYDVTTGIYNCRLDEQWLNLHKDILGDALQITPINDNDPFVPPPSSDAVIEYVNTLGYLVMLKNMSAMSVNDLHQPWRSILPMINMYLTAEEVVPESPTPKASKPKKASSQPPKPKPASTKPSKAVLEKKQKLVKVTPDEPSPAKRLVGKRRKPNSPLKEHNSGRFQPLLEVQGKGKKKVIEEQVALDLLTLQTPKKKISVNQYIFQRRSPMTTGPSDNVESPFLDAKLADNENLKLPTRDQVIIEEPTTSTGTLGSVNGHDPHSSRHIADSSNDHFGELEQHMANLIQYNLALKKRLDKHGSRMYNLENLNIPQKVSKSIDEIVTDAVDWAMQVPLQARFNDLTAIDMKEILQQRMFEDNSYEAHDDHKNLYEALQKSLERDYSNQLLASLDEACRKKRMKRNLPRTPSGGDPSSSKSATLTSQSMAWTTFDTRYEVAGFADNHETSPTYNLTNDGCILDEKVHVSDDEDTGNDHLPKVIMRKDWWKPLPEEDRPATPKPAWTIPSSNVTDVKNNRATLLAWKIPSSNVPPFENSLLVQTRDMTTFLNWYCQKVNKTVLTQADFARQEYEVIKDFCLNVIHVQFQMEEYLDHFRYSNKGSMPALSISKIKDAHYPNFRLELLVPEQMWIDEVCTFDISASYGISHWWFNQKKFYIERYDSSSHQREVRKHMRILSVIRIKAFSRYRYDYLSEIVLRRADFQEHKNVEKDFKNMYPIDFEDLNLLLLQGHHDHLSGFDKSMLSTAVKLWTRNLMIRQQVEDLQLSIESYQT